jgi:histidyl-tRNA synthetase
LQLSRDFKKCWLLLSESDGLKSLPWDFSQRTLSYIENLCYELKHTFNVNTQIDSSVVRSHEYYSGTVFEVDYLQKEQIYLEIAGGSRYNKLIKRFTTGQIPDIPATGFEYGIQRLAPIWKVLNPKKSH